FHLPAQAGGIAQEIRSAQAEQARLQAQLDDLSVRSQVSGRVALPQAQDLPGRWLPRGSLVAHVLAPQQARVRVVVRQDDVARVQREAGPIEVRLAAAPARTLAARLLAHTPAAS